MTHSHSYAVLPMMIQLRMTVFPLRVNAQVTFSCFITPPEKKCLYTLPMLTNCLDALFKLLTCLHALQFEGNFIFDLKKPPCPQWSLFCTLHISTQYFILKVKLQGFPMVPCKYLNSQHHLGPITKFWCSVRLGRSTVVLGAGFCKQNLRIKYIPCIGTNL